MVRNFAILFSQGVFYPGSELEGKLIFDLSEPKAYHYVSLTLVGEAHSFGKGNSSGHVSRQYINSEVIVWNKELATDGRLRSGHHHFPFQFTLPNDNLPASLRSDPNPNLYFIRYYVRGRIGTGSLKFDHTVEVDFRLVELVDINLPALQQPVGGEVQKTTGSWFCASGQITLTAECPRSGYCVGEAIPVSITVENGGTQQIQVSVELWKKVRAYGHYDRDCLFRYPIRSPVAAGRSRIFRLENRIPPTIPTLASCDIIAVKYILVVAAVIPWEGNPSIKIPLTIGNVPLRDRTQGVSDPPPPPPTVSSSCTHPQQGSPSELTRDPPPSYELALQY